MDDMASPLEHGEPGAGGTGSPIERRLVMRLLRYWRDKAEPHDMPARADIEIAAEPEFAPYCWVARLGADEKDLAFETIGEAFAIDQAQTLVGKKVAMASAGTLLAHATAYAANVVVCGVPMSFGGKFRHLDGRTLLFRSIILPLRGSDATIGYLLGGANYRAIHE